ncbi:hypothetical protein BDW72DRAFT_175947 [Aspergillus terricola var. indicus]
MENGDRVPQEEDCRTAGPPDGVSMYLGTSTGLLLCSVLALMTCIGANPTKYIEFSDGRVDIEIIVFCF